MKLNRRSALAIAIVAGALAAVVLYIYVNQATRGATSSTPNTVEVVTAAADITAQSIIKPEQLTTQVLGRNEAPRGAATAPEMVAGRVALVNLPEGQVIRNDQVADPSPSLGLPLVIPDHMRAVTVGLDPISGVAGFLKPGYRVDVLATIKKGDVTITTTVLQNVELLALGQRAQPTPEDRPEAGGRPARPDSQPSATLLVTPEQAQRLVNAESEGKLRLTLRSIEDHGTIDLAKTTDSDVTGVPPSDSTPRRAATPQQSPYTSAGYPPWWYGGMPAMEHGRGAEAMAEAMQYGQGVPAESEGWPVEVIRDSGREVVNTNE